MGMTQGRGRVAIHIERRELIVTLGGAVAAGSTRGARAASDAGDWNRGRAVAYTTMKKLLPLALIAVAYEAMAQDVQCVRERAAMVENIQAYARSDPGLLGPQGISESVLEAVRQTERHRFIPGRSCSVAYMDGPVPIGQGQTISQPFIVALMTNLAAPKFDHTVLEVGTGSGYQAAILARLTRKVCTIEIIPPLAEAAAKLLRDLGYDNVSVKVGDGYHGWMECGPFDAILVTAALGHVPPPLIEQLKLGGRLVMPLGSARPSQQLTVVEKIAPSETRMRSITLVQFVPFTRSKE
jgi:protein-L-isoaspartate(D-aspartate) O-methyltransferase